MKTRRYIALTILILSWALCLSAFEALGSTGIPPVDDVATIKRPR